VILVIGEILFDEFPNYRRLGGAPFNFAYHLKNFGFDVRFISRIGMDDAGKEILEKLESYEFNLDDIQLDDVHPTGRVTVKLDKSGAAQFDIISDVAYDYLEFNPENYLELIGDARLFYFGSLIQRSEIGHETLQKFLAAGTSDASNFCDINLRPRCYTNAIIEKSLLKADILKLSTEELEILRQMLSINKNADAFIQHLMKEYSLGTISLTKGASGSALFTSQGSFKLDAAEAVHVTDSVGAGDAYAAMLAAGILKNWPAPKILQRASLFSSRICEIKGAIPQTRSFYEPFRPLFGSS
jgi:fructokinase